MYFFLRAESYLGTLDYIAPEMLDRKVKYDNAVDLWALGIMCYQMLVSYVPFNGNSEAEVQQNIVK